MARGSRNAEVKLGADSTKLDGGLRRARKKLQKFGDRSRKDLKKSFSGVGRSLGQITGLGGAAGLAVAARDVKAFEERLLRLRIQSGMSADSTAKLRSQLRSMSDDTGIAADSLLDGTAKFVSLTGRMDVARDSLGTFAKVANASGASMEDITATAAALNDSMEIEPEDMEKAFSILLTQGKKGAIELRELASLMATVGSQFPDFGKTGVEGLAELGASLQIMKKGFGTGSEAVTGMMGMMTAFTKKAKEFRKFGIKIFDKDPKTGVKSFRTVQNIMRQISQSKMMDDPEALVTAFGRAEGARAFSMIAKNIGAYHELYRAGMRSSAVQKDYLAWQESSAGKMARSWERIKNTIARAMTPQRIERFAGLMDRVANAVDWIADNLTASIGILAAVKLSPGLAALIGWKGVPAIAAASALAAVPAAYAGYKTGQWADKKLGLSDALAGVEDTTSSRSSIDPEGRASRLRVRARQLMEQAAQHERLDETGGYGRKQLQSALQSPIWSRNARVEMETLAQPIDVGATRRKAQSMLASADRMEATRFFAPQMAGIEDKAREHRGELVVKVDINVDDDGLLRAAKAAARQGG